MGLQCISYSWRFYHSKVNLLSCLFCLLTAFLKFSQTRRAKEKKANPDMSNTDVSRLLGEIWRSASHKERAPYVEQEEQERAIYKATIAR